MGFEFRVKNLGLRLTWEVGNKGGNWKSFLCYGLPVPVTIQERFRVSGGGFWF